MRTFLSVVAVLFFGGIALLGWELSRTGDPATIDLSVIWGPEPKTLDPAVATGFLEARILDCLFEGLVGYDPDRYTPIPGVAERWEISPDGRVYTFHLRHDARWSDGAPVRAEDFRYSWKRALDPETASEYAYQLYPIRNAKPFNEGQLQDFGQVGVECPDPLTVRVTLEKPTPYFLEIAGFMTLLPAHRTSIEKHGSDWIKPGKMVSNGPFVLEDWRPNHRIVVQKNPHYWDRGRVRLGRVAVYATNSSITTFNLYEAGVADWIPSVPLHITEAVRTRPDFHAWQQLGTNFIRFNVTGKPFDDVRVRKAFALVIDRDLIVEQVLRCGETPARVFVPPKLAELTGYRSPEGLAFNPDEARRLLREAGFPEGHGFPGNLSLTIAQREDSVHLAEVIREMWKKELGVEIRIAQQEWKVFLDTVHSLQYDLALLGWIGDYQDPNTFLNMFVTGGDQNETGWGKAQYDAWIEGAASEPLSERRWQLFFQAEKMLVEEEAPITVLYHFSNRNLWKPWVKGIGQNLMGMHPMKFLSVEGRPSSEARAKEEP